jgi:hypothetical protein
MPQIGNSAPGHWRGVSRRAQCGAAAHLLRELVERVQYALDVRKVDVWLRRCRVGRPRRDLRSRQHRTHAARPVTHQLQDGVVDGAQHGARLITKHVRRHLRHRLEQRQLALVAQLCRTRQTRIRRACGGRRASPSLGNSASRT